MPTSLIYFINQKRIKSKYGAKMEAILLPIETQKSKKVKKKLKLEFFTPKKIKSSKIRSKNEKN